MYLLSNSINPDQIRGNYPTYGLGDAIFPSRSWRHDGGAALRRFSRDLNREHGEGTAVGVHPRRNRGFTLVELMIGMLALTIVFAGLFSGLGQATVMADNVRSKDFVNQLLQVEMEDVLQQSWTELCSLEPNTEFSPGTYFSYVPLRGYTCDRSIEELGSSQRVIRLRVTWTDLKGMMHDRELVTFYAENGTYDPPYTIF